MKNFALLRIRLQNNNKKGLCINLFCILVVCLRLAQLLKCSITDVVENLNLRARRGGDLQVLIARL